MWMLGGVLLVVASVHADVTIKHSEGGRVVAQVTCRDPTLDEIPRAVGSPSEWLAVYRTLGNVLLDCQEVPGRDRVCRDEEGTYVLRPEALRGADPAVCREARRQLARCTDMQRRDLSEWCPSAVSPERELYLALCAPYVADCESNPGCPLSWIAQIQCNIFSGGFRTVTRSGEVRVPADATASGRRERGGDRPSPGASEAAGADGERGSAGGL